MKWSKVSFINVPAFTLQKNTSILVEDVGYVNIDVAFGGSFFAIIDAKQFNLNLNIEEQEK